MTGRGSRLWMVALAGWALAGCRSSPSPASPAPHYVAWKALVEAAWRGDNEAVTADATAMVGGAPTEGARGAAAEGDATLGGALGFLRFAGTPDDLAVGIARAAGGCGQCHAAAHVPAPPRPAWTHHTAAQWVVDAVVWHREGDVPAADLPDVVREAAAPAGASDSAEARAARVLATCAGCHAARDR